MRPLTEHEKRTVRVAGIFIAVYLVLFFGFRVWNYAQKKRREYRLTVVNATALRDWLAVYADKSRAIQDMMEQFRMDPAQLSRTTLVAEATAAIHKSAMGSGIQLGSVRETPSGAAARELSAVQLEGMGPVPSILRFLEGLGTLGFPLVADSLELSPAPGGPGQLKMSVTIVILDFDQWKAKEDKPHA